jgi:post-segregation antitoxin (ccd killing protein)
MARVNIWLPDEVAAGVRAAGLNLSMVARVAALGELVRRDTERWLRLVALSRGTASAVPHAATLRALRATSAS